MTPTVHRLLLAALPLITSVLPAGVAQSRPEQGLHRGLHALYSVPLQDYGVDEELFDGLWMVWTGEQRRAAASASPRERRRMTLARYGLFSDPARGSDVPFAFADAGDGRWTMNCLACHSGVVDGAVIHGAAGNAFDFQSLVRDMTALKLRRGLPLNLQEQGMAVFPLGGSAGVSNAQGFSVVLASLRGHDLGFASAPTPLGKALSGSLATDLDAPALWNLARKERLYLDGYISASARVTMQFSLGMEMDPERIASLEPAYDDIWQWLLQLEAPAWPGELDLELARRGEGIFQRTCSRCHGTYGPDGQYPELRVPLAVVGTDPRRAASMPREFREFMDQSWLTEDEWVDVELDPDGYVAPPLHGVWASAPYLHNGSVPTLAQLLDPDQRPAVWRRVEGGGYDHGRVGLAIVEAEAMPRPLDPGVQRRWFDTSRPGKSARGHGFARPLSEEARRALLEYLKTL